MADFVAVIRRAVDGLSDNNAEMRQRVYEKARGAVQRQLESMNPRPSDDLVKRQLDKLEAAIESVEVDHAEALPPDEAAPEPVEDIVRAGFAHADVERVTRLIQVNEYKRRQAPVGVRVTRRSFGKDWRYPMTNKFRA